MSTQSVHRADLDGRNCRHEVMAPGEHCFSQPEGGTPKWLLFTCRHDSRATCQIALRPIQKNGVGASWEWDGNRAAPTIHPSVNCEKVCGWHGWIKEGRFEP